MSSVPSAVADTAASFDQQFEAYYTTRDRVLRNRLVEAHLALAEFHARRFSSAGVSREDVRQVARLAIIGAVDRFDPTRGIAFSTFASRTVEGECQRFLRDRTWGVRPPRQLQEAFLGVRRAHDELTHEKGRRPTISEVADRLGASEEEVIEALEAGNARTLLDLAPSADVSGGKRRYRPPVDKRSVEIDRDGTAYDEVDLRLTLSSLIDRLDERDRELIDLRFTHGWTERRIAEQFGISQSYVSRCLRQILRDLRRMLDDGGA